MNAPHYGDLPQDPQDAAKAVREENDRAPITAKQAAEYFDGKPLEVKAATPGILTMLQDFCSTDENRFVLSKPYNLEGFTWATDGRILIRVPQLAEVENNPEFRYPNAAACWALYPIAGAPQVAMPDLPEDAGRITKCPKCKDGEAYCSHCDNWGTCHHCHGADSVLDNRWMKVDGHPFKLKHLAKVKKLPDAAISVLPRNKTSTFAYLYFKSGAIEGVLAGMTLEPGEDADNEWKPEPAAADSREAA